jgi:hypothetical protein
MASPVFKNGGPYKTEQRFKVQPKKKNSGKPPDPHNCEPVYHYSKVVFGHGHPHLIFDCNEGWCAASRSNKNWGLTEKMPDLEYQGLPLNHLKVCPFCQENLPIVNEVTIT